MFATMNGEPPGFRLRLPYTMTFPVLPLLDWRMPTVNAESAALKSSYRLIVALAEANLFVSQSRYTTLPTEGSLPVSVERFTPVRTTDDILPLARSSLSLA